MTAMAWPGVVSLPAETLMALMVPETLAVISVPMDSLVYLSTSSCCFWI